MSVVVLNPGEVKALEEASVELCGEHLRGPIWAMLRTANVRAYVLSYTKQDMLPEAMQQTRQEYASGTVQAQASAHWDLSTPKGILKELQRLSYHCISNGGNDCLKAFGEEYEQARRRLINAVVFEMMVEGGTWVSCAGYGHIRRVDFDHYQIASTDYATRPPQVHHIQGQPHPLDGFTTTDPHEAFKKVWELHDACAADVHARDEAFDAEVERRVQAGQELGHAMTQARLMFA